MIREISFSKQQDLLAAKAQEDMLRAELDNKKSDFQMLGSQKARYEQLKREVESNKDLYEAFLNREKETNATSDYKNVTARFTDPAIVPLFPIAPQRMKLVLIATFFGFAIACALVIIFETLREVIRTSSDVQDKLGSHLLRYDSESEKAGSSPKRRYLLSLFGPRRKAVQRSVPLRPNLVIAETNEL